MKKGTLLTLEAGLLVMVATGLVLAFFDGVAFVIGIVLLSLTAALLITHIVLLTIDLIRGAERAAKAPTHAQIQQVKMGKADLVKSLLAEQPKTGGAQ